MSATDPASAPVILKELPVSGAETGSSSFKITGELRMLRGQRWRFAFAAVLASMATLCAIGLLATSGWLISRASQMPPVLSLSVAIVCVRAFAIGREPLEPVVHRQAHDGERAEGRVVRDEAFAVAEHAAPDGERAYAHDRDAE